MVEISKVKAGLSRFIDNDIAPYLEDEKERFAVCTAAAGAIYRLENILKSEALSGVYSAIKVMGYIDDNCNVDIDGIKKLSLAYFPAEGFPITVPRISNILPKFLRKNGEEKPQTVITITKEDIDNIHKYIAEA